MFSAFGFDDEKNKYFTQCKNGSFDLHVQIDAHIKSGNAPTPETMERWKEELKNLNKSITKYARVVHFQESRLRLEIELIKQSITHDVLDREATFTSTLEAIRSLEVKAASDDSSSEFLDGTVAKAIQSIHFANRCLEPLTSSKEPFYADAEACAKLTSG